MSRMSAERTRAYIEEQARMRHALGGGKQQARPQPKPQPKRQPKPPRQRPAKQRLDPILPSIRVAAHPAVERGRLIASPLTQERMPLFPQIAREDVCVPLLDLADISGVKSTSRGRGAALELRIATEALLSLDLAEAATSSVRIVWTVAELIEALKPNPGGRQRQSVSRAGDWDRIYQALVALDTRCWVPWAIGPDHVQPWRVFAVRSMPAPQGVLRPDGEVVIEVALPPNSGPGPVVDRMAIRQAGLQSAPSFRSAIGVATLTWLVGRTRVPLPGIGGVWSGNPDRYPVLSARDRRYIAFGAQDGRSLPKLDAAWRRADEAGVITIIDHDAVQPNGKRGWRVVLPSAADAIRSRSKRARSRSKRAQ